MKKVLIVFLFAFLASIGTTHAASYEETVTKWTSYKDVADWMKAEFRYDLTRKGTVHGWNPRTPQETFKMKSGICFDAAHFVRDALNRINPDYHPRIVFIKNSVGPPNHWVTSFKMNGKLYIFDYGTGRNWSSMMGVHGPYDSLDDYGKFLSSLRISNFKLDFVKFTDN